MKMIPAIDIINGNCVRLSQGDYATSKIYNKNPLDVAKQFEDYGIQYLHLVDLDGAKAKHVVNYKILESICRETNLHVDFGGGIKSIEDVRIAFSSGTKQITCGSIAVKQPLLVESWLSEFGSECIILGADCKNEMISTDAWTQESTINVFDCIQRYESIGINHVICTDISKDGMLTGPAIALYEEIIEKAKVKLIASGGVSSLADLATLKKIGCDGAIIGKAIYENKISLKSLEALC